MAADRKAKLVMRDLVRVAHDAMLRQEVLTLAMMEEAAPEALAGIAPVAALATGHMLRAIDLYRRSGMGDRELAAHLRRWAGTLRPMSG